MSSANPDGFYEDLDIEYIWKDLYGLATYFAWLRTSDAVEAEELATTGVVKLFEAHNKGTIHLDYDLEKENFVVITNKGIQCSVGSYLKSIIGNIHIDTLRDKKRKTVPIEPNNHDEADNDYYSKDLPSNSPTPDSEFLQKEESKQVREFLSELEKSDLGLSKQEREVLDAFMTIMWGKIENNLGSNGIHSEIAEILNINPGLARSVLNRVRTKLRNWLKCRAMKNPELPEICQIILNEINKKGSKGEGL